MLDWEATDTWWYVDRVNNMMLTQTYHGLGENGKHDAIGTAWNAYFTYRDERFLNGIASCWSVVYRRGLSKFFFGGYYYKGQRYPQAYPEMKPMSRDHAMNTIQAFYHSGMSKDALWEFCSHLPFILGRSWGMHINLKMYLWMRALCDRKGGWFYYPYTAVSMYFKRLNNKFMYWVTGYKDEEHQDVYRRLDVAVWDTPRIIKMIAGLFYPTYAMQHVAWQLQSLGDNWWTMKIRKLMLPMIPKHNYAIKLLLRGTVTKEEVYSYKPMTGDRWSDTLNKWLSNRFLTVIQDQQCLRANALDRDYLIKLYEYLNK